MRNFLVGLMMLVSFLGLSHEDDEFVEDVFVRVTTDPITGDIQQTMVLAEKGIKLSEFSLDDRTLSIFCQNSTFVVLVFGSAIYLDNKNYGNLTYRVDDGEVKTVRASQDNKLAGIADPFEAYDIAFSGTNVVIEATAYSGDTDTAEFDTTYLGTAMAHVGCEFQ